MKKVLVIAVYMLFNFNVNCEAQKGSEQKTTIELSFDDKFLKDIYHGNYEGVQNFIKSGVSVNEASDLYGRGPLIWATMNDDKKMVKMLLDAGADTEVKDKFGNTPFVHAAHLNDKDLIALLLGKKLC